MSSQRKFKTALDENRLLIMASQIVFAFQFSGIFQSGFDSLPRLSRAIDGAALLTMSITIALLIAPSAWHRLACGGRITGFLFRAIALLTGAALLPFSLSLAFDFYIVFARVFGGSVGLAVAGFLFVLSLIFWYALEFLWNKNEDTPMPKHAAIDTPLESRIEHMLTEARLTLPGAQALLGFQLLAMLTTSFDGLPQESKLVHAFALICVGVTIVLLIAPAAFHRISFNGRDSERFYRIGSTLVAVALLPLALGMAGDVYVAIAKLAENDTLGIVSGAGIFGLLIALWYVVPLLMRRVAHGG
jgi:hypothetical protein